MRIISTSQHFKTIFEIKQKFENKILHLRAFIKLSAGNSSSSSSTSSSSSALLSHSPRVLYSNPLPSSRCLHFIVQVNKQRISVAILAEKEKFLAISGQFCCCQYTTVCCGISQAHVPCSCCALWALLWKGGGAADDVANQLNFHGQSRRWKAATRGNQFHWLTFLHFPPTSCIETSSPTRPFHYKHTHHSPHCHLSGILSVFGYKDGV